MTRESVPTIVTVSHSTPSLDRGYPSDTTEDPGGRTAGWTLTQTGNPSRDDREIQTSWSFVY